MVSIIVTGAVAVGKSFLINLIIEWFGVNSIVLFPEFIHEDQLGQALLKKSFEGKVSPITLQSYVMDQWLNNAKKNSSDEHKDKIKLFERLPIDAYEIFSSTLSDAGKISQREQLKAISQFIPVDYEFPHDKTLWIRYHNSLIKDNSEQLRTQLESSIDKYEYIVIEITTDSPFINYLRRSRRGEKYSEESINSLCDAYSVFLGQRRSKYSSIIEINKSV